MEIVGFDHFQGVRYEIDLARTYIKINTRSGTYINQGGITNNAENSNDSVKYCVSAYQLDRDTEFDTQFIRWCVDGLIDGYTRPLRSMFNQRGMLSNLTINLHSNDNFYSAKIELLD